MRVRSSPSLLLSLFHLSLPVSLVVCGAAPALAAPPPAAPPVTLVAGEACELRASSTADWAPAPAGTTVAVGNWIRPRTGSELSASFTDGVTVHLGAGAMVALGARAWVPGEVGVNGGKPVRASQLVLHAGELTATVPPAAPGSEATTASALVVTASGGAQVGDWRGTMRVAEVDEGVLATAVDGATLVGSSGRWLTISGGTGAVLRPHAGPEIHHTLVAAPAWSTTESSPPFSLVQSGALASFTLAWAPVDRAVKYRVHLASDPSMTHVVSTTDAGPSTRITTAQLAPGRYYAAVEAASPEGLFGAAGAVRALRVASMTVPPGALLARDGAILMPERTALTFDDPTGLELALQPILDPTLARLAHSAPPAPATLTFLAAPPRLKLGMEHQIVAIVRDTASGTMTNLTLAQRELRARIEIGPKFAHWPENDVIARVTLEDPSGRIDVSTEEPKLRVKINVDDVPVTWTKSHDFWFVHIPPALPPGPWVVGVIASDRAGIPIGEGYLEVTGPPRPAGGDHGTADKTEVKILR